MDDALAMHRMLLKDTVRMDAYRSAIASAVRTGDTVVDIGSGTGILAMFACQAGARRVYAIERGPIVAAARELAAANGFADRIVFFNQELTSVSLPERVDAIVSELIPKAALGQCMAELVGWARDHFLKPSGKIVPERVDLCVAPLTEPRLSAFTTLPERERYGLDFEPLSRRSACRPVSLRVSPTALLAPEKIAYTYDAQQALPVDTFDTNLTFDVGKEGVLSGWATWFTSILAPGVSLSNRPPGIASWDNLAFPLPQPVVLCAGDHITLRFRGRADSRMPEMWAWDTTVFRNGDQICAHRQSTFQAELLSPERLIRAQRKHSA